MLKLLIQQLLFTVGISYIFNRMEREHKGFIFHMFSGLVKENHKLFLHKYFPSWPVISFMKLCHNLKALNFLGLKKGNSLYFWSHSPKRCFISCFVGSDFSGELTLTKLTIQRLLKIVFSGRAGASRHDSNLKNILKKIQIHYINEFVDIQRPLFSLESYLTYISYLASMTLQM